MAQLTALADAEAQARRFEMRALMRLAVWGTSAAVALLVAVLAGYPNLTSQRLVATPAGQAQPQADVSPARVATRSIEADDETRRLAEAVRALHADRQELLARITALEQSLEDITGSNRQAAARSAAPSEPAPPPVVVETTSLPPLALSSPVAAAAQIPAAPSTRLANLPVIEAMAEATLTKAELGVDLGGAVNFDALRVLWNSIKAGYAAEFDGLAPLVVVRENSKSRAAELRLIVGPLPDAETAERLCAALSPVHRTCQPVPFEGQKFAVSVPEPESKPAPVPERRPARPPAPPPVRTIK